VVALAGLAHSGKSTAASVLQQLLSTRGYGSAIVSLDGWIRPAGDRPSADPSGSYDYTALGDALTGLQARTAPRVLQVPQYDRATQTRRNGATLEVRPSDVVLLEGVVALDVAPLRETLDLAVWVECDEVLRRQRFVRDYRWRGYSDKEAEALYEQREQTEHPLVRACRARADVVVEHNA
jgi:uridine kinase